MSKRKISDYFSKNTNQDDCEPTSSKNSTKTPSTLNKMSNISEKTSVLVPVLNSISQSPSVSVFQDQTESMHANENDISLFVNCRLSDADKFTALKNVWLPLPIFEFPLNQKNKKRGLKFQYKWLLQFNWLAYSKIKNGAYCKFCVVFSKCGGIGNQPLNKLVLEAFDAWKKALENVVTISLLFLMLIILLVYIQNNNHQLLRLLTLIAKIKENRAKLIPIIECLILCGRQEIALRGHRDSGKINVNDDSINDGNFRAILRYRGKGDEFLKQNLENDYRYKYIGSKIQNEMIIACGDIIQKKIVKKINDSQCFSILADETTDISTNEQLTLCVRYLDTQNNMCEDFLQYIKVDSLTGISLSSAIINGLISCGVQCDFLFGQGFDGASNMSGKFNGVQAIIREQYPQAIYVHCAAHSLNLAVSTASNIKPIRNCLGILEKMYVFLKTPKRNNALLIAIDKGDFEPKIRTLKRLCATRWVQRYDAVNDFVELFPCVVAALEIITEWNDSSATDAAILLKAIDSEFLISLQITKFLFSYGLPLCKQLQSKKIDLVEAVCLAEDIISALKNIRINIEQEFNNIFLMAEVIKVN
ncbi:zinc finger MYM-type protein 1-like [Rhopalosiphum padi]|uniref:zinc finger MYM-type protein 1-like n=1 Tax=Rhopalosiphum padi TaxID=40932 RepID=UPI00298E93FA|nr:zinc finger MYM-type protein 1-like [Rhopalosiphum padi]